MLAFPRTQRSPVRAADPQLDPSAAESSHAVAQSLFDAANREVQGAFEKEKIVEQELRAVAAAAKRFEQQQQQWTKLIDRVHDALKEIGDVENWLHVIESDVAHIEATVSLAVEKRRGANP